MSFPSQNGRPFTRAGIEVLAPNQNGVYGLYRSDAWVYVGRATCIRTRLLSHFNGGNPAITKERPTHFYTSVTTNDEAVEKSLIIKLNPIANKKIG